LAKSNGLATILAETMKLAPSLSGLATILAGTMKLAPSLSGNNQNRRNIPVEKICGFGVKNVKFFDS
jgi:hypothetical protein